MSIKKKVYLDAGTLEQFQKVRDEYRNTPEGDELEYVFLTNGDQIKEESAEIWRCSELDRQVASMYNNRYFDM